MRRIPTLLTAFGALAVGAAGCGDTDLDEAGGLSGTADKLRGAIRIDGSSTVYPYAQAAAEQFQAKHPGVKVSVGQSGTGGGFEKFCAGETDISNASRAIKADEEVPLCEKGGVEFTELQVANDGIAVVANKELAIDCLTTEQLEELWATPRVKRYDDIDADLPGERVSLFGPGTDSGTFDFFTDEINGEEGRTRKDYQPSEDDNVLVRGVEGDNGALGYFGFSYYEQNAGRLRLVAVDAGKGCLEPTSASIQSGEYEPLSRPLFMYPSKKALGRPEVKAFMRYIADNHEKIATDAQIVPMNAGQATKTSAALAGAAG